jgi:hypothetical protein
MFSLTTQGKGGRVVKIIAIAQNGQDALGLCGIVMAISAGDPHQKGRQSQMRLCTRQALWFGLKQPI